MRLLTESPFVISRLSPNSTAAGSFIGGWVGKCHGFLHNTVLVLAAILFVAYLAYEAKKSLAKLSNRRSYIMIAYYGCLWLVSLLNLAWCCLQAWECTPGKEVVWNLLTLFTTSGMLFLEVSLVAFLFQGNYASGAEALTRTFLISGLVIGLDLLLKAIYLFGFGIQLFIDNNEHIQKFKWGPGPEFEESLAAAASNICSNCVSNRTSMGSVMDFLRTNPGANVAQCCRNGCGETHGRFEEITIRETEVRLREIWKLQQQQESRELSSIDSGQNHSEEEEEEEVYESPKNTFPCETSNALNHLSGSGSFSFLPSLYCDNDHQGQQEFRWVKDKCQMEVREMQDEKLKEKMFGERLLPKCLKRPTSLPVDAIES